MSKFEADPYPGGPRLLFIGMPHSTHTHGWIDLLSDAPFNVRLFGVPGSLEPPADWEVRTYLASVATSRLDPNMRRSWYPPILARIPGSHKALPRLFPAALGKWLAHVIRKWQPDIIQTMRLDGGHFFWQVRERYRLSDSGCWVLHLWGGPDLELARFDPEAVPWIIKVASSCDQLIDDNWQNVEYLREMGIANLPIAPIFGIPGAGGVDVDTLSQAWQGPPSQRRSIVWTKAYTSPWSIGLPVLEALRLCWDRIAPVDVYMLASTPDIEMWVRTLPESLRSHCHIQRRIPRQQALDLMLRARVLLLPSLIEGVPNALYEAMACGAFPIVSPLPTIAPVVHSEQNVLFARNLYPEEIANALVRAMSDDALVDTAAARNIELVRQIANRSAIRTRVIRYYEELAQNGIPSSESEVRSNG